MSIHHVHVGRRQKGEPLSLLDKAVYVSGIISLAMMFPQLKLIYMGKEAGGIEPITWITLSILDIPWIVYGIMRREKPLIFIYTGWLIVNGLIFVGSVMY
ncbi:MAG: hypothetical protein WAX80_01375 [Minisyncoccia bacterium]